MEHQKLGWLMKWLRRVFYLSGVVLLVVVVRGAVAFFFGAAAPVHVPLAAGDMEVPTERSIAWKDESALTQQILSYWAAWPLGDWATEGKIKAPRALMGRFLLRQDLVAANDYLQSVHPWGRVGSTWALHPAGDYDFTMAALIPMLYLFGDEPEVLFPETREHLLEVLLPLEGGDPLERVPRTLGWVKDTENHVLMTEGSRYLKNRWLAGHGQTAVAYDNERNGLEAWLLGLLSEFAESGFYEFNSIPYEGYTLTALLNLEAFGSEAVQAAARNLLDRLNWKYALGSLSFRRFPPFRRRYSHAEDTALDGDRHTPLMKAWMSLHPAMPDSMGELRDYHIALWACWAPYRLPDRTAEWMLHSTESYFVRMGHGPNSSPELYAGGAGWLLTGGGVHRGKRSMVIARPTTLLLDDGATELEDVVHLSGVGTDFRQWNHTGVWRNMAVAAGPVHVPACWTPDAEGALWQVYGRGALCVAVHSQDGVGLIYVARSADSQAVLEAVESVNEDAEALRHTFQLPGGERVEYAVDAPKDQWVITCVDGLGVDRAFDGWPLMSGVGGDGAEAPYIGRLAGDDER